MIAIAPSLHVQFELPQSAELADSFDEVEGALIRYLGVFVSPHVEIQLKFGELVLLPDGLPEVAQGLICNFLVPITPSSIEQIGTRAEPS